jgi:RNA polymerase sigma-70 factor, ECF subfamily
MDTPVTLLKRLCVQPAPGDWEHFVSLFTPLLRRWAVRFGVAAGDIEDILQDVFVLLLRELPRFEYDPSRSFRAWLWTVFRRNTLAWHKSQPRERFCADLLEQMPSPDGLAEASEQEYRRYLLSRIMRIVQGDYPERTWQIFEQVAVHGRKAAEIAREFGVTVNAVYLIRGRVMARLHEELAELGE